MLRMWYFALTTLSTVGYGDYSPISSPERIIGAMILLAGVAIFSIFQGSLNDMIVDYREKTSSSGDFDNLYKWMSFLQRFNQGKRLNKELKKKIEHFFEYYWENDRLNPVRSEENQQYMNELPKTIRRNVSPTR